MKLFGWSFFTPKPVFKPTIEKLITGLQDGSVILEDTSLEPGSDSLQPGQQVQLFQHVLDPESNHPLADEVVLEEVAVLPTSSVKPPVDQRMFIQEKGPLGLRKEKPVNRRVEVVLGNPIGNWVPVRGPVEQDGRNFTLISRKILKVLNVHTEKVNLDILDANISTIWNFVGKEDILQVIENGNLELKPGSSIWITFEADKKEEEGKKVPKLIKDISTVKPEVNSLVVELFVPPNENMLMLRDGRALSKIPRTFNDSLGYFNWLLVNFMKPPKPYVPEEAQNANQ